MNFGYVFVLYFGSYRPRCLLVLLKLRVVRVEYSNVLHHYFIGLSFEAEYFETTQRQHLVLVEAIVNWKQLIEELVLSGKGSIGRHPVLTVAHL